MSELSPFRPNLVEPGRLPAGFAVAGRALRRAGGALALGVAALVFATAALVIVGAAALALAGLRVSYR